MIDRTRHFSLNWAAERRQRFSVAIVLDEGVRPEHLNALNEALARFVRVGARGGFARNVDERGGEGGADCLLVASELGDPGAPRFELEAGPIDVRAFSVLRNIVAHFAARTHDVRSLDVTSASPVARPVEMPALDWTNAHLLYPDLIGNGALRVERDDPQDYQKNRRCVVEFEQRASRASLETLREWIDDWASLVELGAYAEPVGDAGAAESQVDTLQIFDAYSVELVFSVFEAAEESWHALIAMLNRFSADVGRLALVSIE